MILTYIIQDYPISWGRGRFISILVESVLGLEALGVLLVDGDLLEGLGEVPADRDSQETDAED